MMNEISNELIYDAVKKVQPHLAQLHEGLEQLMSL